MSSQVSSLNLLVHAMSYFLVRLTLWYFITSDGAGTLKIYLRRIHRDSMSASTYLHANYRPTVLPHSLKVKV